MISLTLFFILIPILTFVLLAINLLFAPHKPYQEKNSVFECGYHSFLGQNRTQFSISFFIFALLFLLFDLEILLVYPYIVSAYSNGIYGLFLILIFFLMLTLGFAFELGKKALSIESRQISDLENIEINYASITYIQSCSHIKFILKITRLLAYISTLLAPTISKYLRVGTIKAQLLNCAPVLTIKLQIFGFFVLGLLINKLSEKIIQYFLNITYIADFFYFINKIKHCFNKFLGMFFLSLNAENTKVEANVLYRLITCFFTKYGAYIFAVILFCFACSLISVENYLDFCIKSLSMYIIYFILSTYVICLSFCIFLYLTYINLYIKDNYPALYVFIMYSLLIIIIINVYNIISVFKSIVDLVYGFVYMNSDNGPSQGGPTGNSDNSGRGPSGGGPSEGGPLGGNTGKSGEDNSERDQIWEEDGRILVRDINGEEYLTTYNEFKNNKDPIIQEINRNNKNANARECYHKRMEIPEEREHMREYWRHYDNKPHVKERKKAFHKEYIKRPHVNKKIRDYLKEYNQRPDVKERNRINRKERRRKNRENKDKT